MKICAGIILFHPDIERLRQNIGAVLPQVDRLVLINNAPDETQMLDEALSSVTADTASGKTDGIAIVRINNEENLGIAAALNQLLAYAGKNGYRWVLTLDQDSICGENLVEKLCEAADDHGNAAMVSPLIIERGTVWEDKKPSGRADKEKKSQKAADVEDIPFCITSGTLTNVEAVQNAGGFNERLFIDEVDRDMCIRLRYKGHRILRVNTVKLEHEFGVELVHRRLLFKVYKYRNYSPFRVYYQIRNMVYMVRKYGADYKPYPLWRLIRPFLTFTVKFIFEPHRLKRLSAFFRGYTAGLFMKL